MPDDASGNASRPPNPIPVSGQGADAPQVNVPIDDIYACLNRRHFSDGRKPFSGHQNFNGYKATGAASGTDPQDYVTLAQVEEFIGNLSQVPTGAIVPLTGNTVPAGWVRANGQWLSRSTYPRLWAFAQASGNLAASEGAKTLGQYGPGDGTSNFTLPNLEAGGGYFIRPVSSGRGIGTVQAEAVGPHPHEAKFAGDPVEPHSHAGAYITIGTGSGSIVSPGTQGQASIPAAGGHTPSGTVSVSSNTGSVETRPRNVAYPMVIKT